MNTEDQIREELKRLEIEQLQLQSDLVLNSGAQQALRWLLAQITPKPVEEPTRND